MNIKTKARQRKYGIIMIISCIIIIALTSQGKTVEEQDTTAVLFLAPLGVCLLFSKKQLVYDICSESVANKVEPLKVSTNLGGGVNASSTT